MERENVAYINCDQQTLLHSAVILGNFEIVQFLTNVADPEVFFIRDRFGRTPFDHASSFQDTVIMEHLLKFLQPRIDDESELV